MEVQFHSLLTSAIDAAEWSPSRSGNFCAEEEPWYPFSKGFGDPRDGVNILDKLRFNSAQNNCQLYGVNVYAEDCLFLQRSKNKIYTIIGTHT